MTLLTRYIKANEPAPKVDKDEEFIEKVKLNASLVVIGYVTDIYESAKKLIDEKSNPLYWTMSVNEEKDELTAKSRNTFKREGITFDVEIIIVSQPDKESLIVKYGFDDEKVKYIVQYYSADIEALIESTLAMSNYNFGNVEIEFPY